MSTSENLDLQLQFHFAVCILHFAFCILHFAFCILQVAVYKICRWRKQTFPNAFTKSMWNWAKRRTMLATFRKVFGSGHLEDAKLSSSVLAHCWLSNLFCKLTNKGKALMNSTPKFASCKSCTDAGFCTLGQHWQEIWEIAKILTCTQTIF